MRLLVVSNYYPPHFIGGYELGCRDIVELLRSRGHEILVLTSIHGVPAATDEQAEPGVRRQLHFEGDEPGYRPDRYYREAVNRRYLRAALASFQPELVYFWNQARLPGSLVRLTREAGVPYVFYLSDHSFLEWRVDSLWRRWIYPASTQPLKAAIKRLLKNFLSVLSLLQDEPQQFYHPRQFTSQFLQRFAGKHPPSATDRVIPWGVDTARFSSRAEPPARPSRLLYVGQIVPHKGTITALEALALLRRQPDAADLTLTVVGGALKPVYLEELQAFAAAENLGSHVRFEGKIDRQLLAGLYQQHDILIFPSQWEEPFAITPLEAMASGLAVVGTGTGGSQEIFEDGQTAMVFQPGDAPGCAAAIRALMEDHALYQKLCAQGRRLVEERYSLDRMVDAIEEHLREVAAQPRP